jgi:hypothetical protein
LNRLELAPGSRAISLFNCLEADFHQFIDQLPAGLRSLATLHSTYHGDLDDRIFDGLSGLNPVLAGTPWLFWECFESLDDPAFQSIALAGTCYVLASVVMDHLMDGQTKTPGSLALYHQCLYSQGLLGYRSIFPVTSPFWSQFSRLEQLHVTGLSLENEAQRKPEVFSKPVLGSIACGKVAPINITLAAFCTAANRSDIRIALENSLNYIAVASQMLDDFGDWQDDLSDRHMTHFLSQLITKDGWQHPDDQTKEAIRHKILAGWHDVACLKEIRGELSRSITAVEQITCPTWVNYVQEYLDLTNEHLEQALTNHLYQVFREMTTPEQDSSDSEINDKSG